MLNNELIKLITEENYESLTEFLKVNLNSIEILEDISGFNLSSKNKYIGKIYNNSLILEDRLVKIENIKKNRNYVKVLCVKHFEINDIRLDNFKIGKKPCSKCYSETVSRNLTTHGLSDHPAYVHLKSAKHRCSSNKKGYEHVSVCDRWLDPANGVHNFIDDMGSSYYTFKENNPDVIISLDRIDNSKGYSLENCRWSTVRDQNRNKTVNVVNSDIVKLLKYEHYLLKYDTTTLSLRYDLKVRTVGDILRKPSETRNVKVTWEDIELVDNETYINILLKNINRINITAFRTVDIPMIKYTIYENIKNMNLIPLLGLAKKLNTTSDAISSRRVRSNSNYYKFKQIDEFLLYTHMIRAEININQFPTDIIKEYNKFVYIFNIRNDYELYKLPIDDIYTKYSKINKETIDNIISYKIYPWYKPIKFATTPLKIDKGN